VSLFFVLVSAGLWLSFVSFCSCLRIAAAVFYDAVSFSIARSFALLLREFAASSSGEAVSGFR